MFLNSPKNIDNIELEDLLSDMIELPQVFEIARALVAEIDMKKDRPEQLQKCIALLDYLLGGCENYFDYIEPVINKYYWFEKQTPNNT